MCSEWRGVHCHRCQFWRKHSEGIGGIQALRFMPAEHLCQQIEIRERETYFYPSKYSINILVLGPSLYQE